MTGWQNERGYILAEVLAGSFLLIVLAGAIMLFKSAASMRSAAIMRSEAMFLAQGELAYLEYENKLQGINVGKYAWLGDPSELTSNNADYEVAAVVTQKAKDEYIAEVTVSWDMASKKKQLVLGRSIYARNGI